MVLIRRDKKKFQRERTKKKKFFCPIQKGTKIPSFCDLSQTKEKKNGVCPNLNGTLYFVSFRFKYQNSTGKGVIRKTFKEKNIKRAFESLKVMFEP